MDASDADMGRSSPPDRGIPSRSPDHEHPDHEHFDHAHADYERFDHEHYFDHEHFDHEHVDRDAVLARLRGARFSDGVFCPRCDHRQVQRWGTFSGRQRYRCKNCRRTFSDLTGTPAAYLKKIELLPDYGHCLDAQLSVRRCALRLGIDPSTAFRWRHRLLDWLRAHDTESVSGWVELGSFWLPESHKGQRKDRGGRSRRPRRNGSGRRRSSRWNLLYDGPRVHVVVACDRTGRIVSGPYPHPTRGALSGWGMEAVIGSRIEAGHRLNLTASRESRSAARTFATRNGATYHDAHSTSGSISGGMPGRTPLGRRGHGRLSRTGSRVRPHPGRQSPVHVRTVVAYIRRLRDWLIVFRGVATSYLPNYLIWHRLVDCETSRLFQCLLLPWSRRPVAQA